MQDQIAPPEVPEDEAGGGEAVVRLTIVDNEVGARVVATARTVTTATVSTRRQWITATVLFWTARTAAGMRESGRAPVLLLHTGQPIPSPYQRLNPMLLPASSRS